MSIGFNFLNKNWVFNQVMQNLRGLQYDIRRNAITWKAQAQAQSPPLQQLKTNISDAATQYEARLAWVTTLRADPVKRQRLLDILADNGCPEQDIIDYVTNLKTVADQIQAATPATYNAIINMCDQITAVVEAPESLWPE